MAECGGKHLLLHAAAELKPSPTASKAQTSGLAFLRGSLLDETLLP